MAYFRTTKKLVDDYTVLYEVKSCDVEKITT